ncbi:MAG: hypothetical protein HQ553_11520 [Chloroflexi bacterium]|nr:hypothetical protein [Chloroflexota bacterium]
MRHNILEMIKNTFATTLFLSGLIVSWITVVFGICGFLIAKYSGGDQEGIQGRVRSIILPLGKFKLHLHHWIIFILAMFAGLAKSIFIYIPPEMFYGLLGGLAWQGVYSYGDWHKVIYRRHSDL